MKKPSFIQWATSKAGMYLHDKKKPTLATWDEYELAILDYLFPAGDTEDILPHNRIIWSRVKKSGKSELAAALHIYFALFIDVPGEQYVLANDYEGAKSRVFKSIIGSLEKNPSIKDDQWRQVASEIVFTRLGSTIKAIAADYRGEAGSNHSFVSVDEPWGIIHEGGMRLMTEFSPVPTRPNSTIVYTGYQGFEGQSDYWHNLIDAGMGEPVPELAHLDNGDGQPACWKNGKMFVYWDHGARKPWQTPEFMSEQKKSFAGRMSEYLRVWENRRVKNAEAFITAEQWEKLYSPSLRGLHPEDKRLLVLGGDAGIKSDSCALVGVTWDEASKKVQALYCRIWKPEPGYPVQLTKTIGPEIVELARLYHVVAVAYDPYQMAAIAEMCRDAKVNMVEFPQTTRRIESDTHLHSLAWGNNLEHIGDPVLTEHVTNALAKANERGMRIVKEMSSAKVDAAVALAMATLVAVELLTEHTGKFEMQKNPFFR